MEYWEVTYKAIADWSDLRDETRKARGWLAELSDAARAEGDVESGAALKAAAAHRVDTAAIDAERRALAELSDAARRAAVWTEFGGRNDMPQHLADLSQEKNWKDLINRADWLGFSSPQAAYSWRQRELEQGYLMNRAHFGATSAGTGYTTADQYLAFLQKERTGIAGQNETLLARAAVYKSNAEAYLAYANALKGHVGTLGTLSEGNLSSAQAYEAALAGLPPQVTTRLTLDDTGFIAKLAADRAMLTDFSRTYTARDIITASYGMGAVPLDRPRPPAADGEAAVSFGGPWQEQAAAVLALVAELSRQRIEIPVDFRADEGSAARVAALLKAGRDIAVPPVLVTAGGAAGGGGGPPDAGSGPDPAVSLAAATLELDSTTRALIGATLALDTATLALTGATGELSSVTQALDTTTAPLIPATADLVGITKDLVTATKALTAATRAEKAGGEGGAPAAAAASSAALGGSPEGSGLLSPAERAASAAGLLELAVAADKLAASDRRMQAESLSAAAGLLDEVAAAEQAAQAWQDLDAAQAAAAAAAATAGEAEALAGEDAAKSAAEVKALTAAMKAEDAAAAELIKLHLQGKLSLPLPAAAAGGGGGGAGKPPLPVPAGAAPDPGDAHAWDDLAAAEAAAGNEAEVSAVKMALLDAAAAGDADAAGKLAYAYQVLTASEKDAGDGTARAADRTRTLGDVLGAAAAYLQRTARGWGILNAQLLVFSGLMGAVSLWHLLFDALLEIIIVLVTAIGTLVAGIGAFLLVATLAQDTLGRIRDRMVAVNTAATATGQAIYPLANGFDALARSVRPEVFQLFGDALTLASGKMGVIGQLGISTGRVLDTLGARFVVDMQAASGAINKFLASGAQNLKGLGEVFSNIGHILSSLIIVAERTHIAEDLLAVAAAVTSLLARLSDLIRTPVGGWIATLLIGFHGVWIWGGLAATSVLGLVRSLALMAGGTSQAESALGRLAASSSGMARFRAIVSDIGAGFAALPGRLTGSRTAIQQVADVTGKSSAELAAFRQNAEALGQSVISLIPAGVTGKVIEFGAGLKQADYEALQLAAAAGASDTQLAQLAVRMGSANTEARGLTAAAESAGGGVAQVGLSSKLATGGLTALAAAAAVFIALALTAKDNTQKWVNEMNSGLGQGSILTVTGRTMADLAAVTDQLTHSQGLNAQAAHELGGMQDQLSGQLRLELAHIGDVSRAYGVNMPLALGLLNTAGVKTSTLFTSQNKVWATAMQQVAGLVTGYKAMGQGLTQLQGDVSVQLVTGSDQVKQMQTLNQAWDQWLTTVQSGPSAMVKFQQSVQTLGTDLGKAGTSLGGLNAQSLTARGAFNQMVPEMGQVLDAVRQYSAVLQNGAQGSALLVRATKDVIASSGLLGTTNQQVRNSLIAVAEQADPSVSTWQKLTRWVGKQGAAQAAADLDSVMTQLQTPVSNLAADAAKLTTSLQQDLNPAMAAAEFNALGGQQAFSTFATDLKKFGPGSQATVSAGHSVAQMLLSIDKNSSTAKDQFVAWGESMGLSQKQATTLWGEVSKGQAPLESVRKGLASSAKASTDLAGSGFFAQRGDQFRTNMRNMADWFSVTLPDGIKTFARAWDGFWGGAYETFIRDVGAPIGQFFTGAFVGFFTQTIPRAWGAVWSTLATPVEQAVGSVKHAFTSGFDNWWKTHGDAVKNIWNSVTQGISLAWDMAVAKVKRTWDDFAGLFRGGAGIGKEVGHIWDDVLPAFRDVLHAVEIAFKGSVDAVVAVGKTAWDILAAALKTAWALALAVLKTAWDALMLVFKVVWDIFVGIVSVAIDLITGHFNRAWHDIEDTARQVGHAIWDFLRQGINNFIEFFDKLWHNALTLLEQVWHNWWNWFTGFIVANFGTFFTRTIPHWFNDLVSGAKSAWNSVWGAFDRIVVGGLTTVFTKTIPGWWNSFVRGGSQAMGSIAGSIESGFRNAVNWVISNVINGAIRIINDITGVFHIPKINPVGGVGGGGAGRAASGGVMPARMAAGSVPGTGDADGTHIIAMGGEYMLRKPARMALEAAYGRGFMNHLNQADSWLAAGSRGSPESQQRHPGRNYAGGGLVQPMAAGGTYQDPLRAVRLLTPERIDMGVDYNGFGPLYAVGPGTIQRTAGPGWPGGVFIEERLSSGSESGRYIYYAEDIRPSVGAGQTVDSNTVIGQLFGGSSGIEIGWGVPGSDSTLASAFHQQSPSGDPGSRSTAYGASMNAFLVSLGAPSGKLQGAISGNVSGGYMPPGGFGGLGSGIVGVIEGLLNSGGSALSSAVSALSGLVRGGASEAVKLAQQGARFLFDGAWDNVISPLVNQVPAGNWEGSAVRLMPAAIKKGIDSFLGAKDSAAQVTAASASSSPGMIGPVSGPADAGPAQAEAYAQSRLPAYGWGPGQFSPLQSLWNRESGWNRFAQNPSSGAYGIPQALPPSKLPPAGRSGGGSHASPQIDWGLSYIKGTPGYGSPSAAWAHELAHNWYPFGGIIGEYAAAGEVPAMAPAMASGGSVYRFPVPSRLHAYDVTDKGFRLAWDAVRGPAGQKPTGYGVETYQLNSKVVDKFTARMTNTAEYGFGGKGLHPDWQYRTTVRPEGAPQAPLGQASMMTRLHKAKAPAPGKPPPKPPPGPVNAPEWDATSVALHDAAYGEMSAFWNLMGMKLPKQATRAQHAALSAWDRALEAQQLKTVGIGRKPPGAYAAIEARRANPKTITAGEWNTFFSDLGREISEEAGPGIKGGTNPPGTPANSGWVPWHYFRGQWQALRTAMLEMQSKGQQARGVWSNLYGPSHLPSTPGPPHPPAATPVQPGGPGHLLDLRPLIIGGPAAPVTGARPDMGFASGGTIGLQQVAEMFAGAMPTTFMVPSAGPGGVSDALLRQLSGGGQGKGPAESPRRLSQAGAAHRAAFNVEQMTINNPVSEQPSMSIARASNRMAFLAGRGEN